MATDSSVERQLMNSDANAGLEALMKPAGGSSDDSPRGEKRKREDDDEEENLNDEVRLWEDGFKVSFILIHV